MVESHLDQRCTAGAILSGNLPPSVVRRNPSTLALPEFIVLKILNVGLPVSREFLPRAQLEGLGDAPQDGKDSIFGLGVLRLCAEAVLSLTHSFQVRGHGYVSEPLSLSGDPLPTTVSPLEVLISPRFTFECYWKKRPHITITLQPGFSVNLSHVTICLDNSSVAGVGTIDSNAECIVLGKQTPDDTFEAIHWICKRRSSQQGVDALIPGQRPKRTYEIFKMCQEIPFQSIRFQFGGLGRLNQCIRVQSIELYGTLKGSHPKYSIL